MKNPDKYFMDIAKRTAEQTKCLSRRCGAVIVLDDNIVSTGYNGPPRNFPNPGTKDFSTVFISKFNFRPGQVTELENGECPRRILGFISGEGLNYCPCSHSEQNAISNAARLGANTNRAAMYVWAEIPICMNCANSIINAGIREVITEHLESYEVVGFSGIDILLFSGIKVRKPNYE